MRTLIYNLTSFLAMLAAVGLPIATHASDYPNRPLLWLHHTAQAARQIYQPGLWRAPRQHSWASPCW